MHTPMQHSLSCGNGRGRTTADMAPSLLFTTPGQGESLKRIAIAILLALAASPASATGMRTSLRVGAVVFRSCKVEFRTDVPLLACTRPGDTTARVTSTPRAQSASKRGYQYIEVNL